MKSFENVKDTYLEDIKGIDVSKEHPEKFMVSYLLAKEENKALLAEYNINLKPSEWIVLSIDPEVLKKTILRAKDLLFLDAYIKNPAYLKADVDDVIKRMSELDSLGIAYKNEEGKYLSYLFSKRAFEYIKSTGKKTEEKLTINDIELKELADRIMETYAFLDKKEEVYEKLAKSEKMGLSLKESLMAAFKTYSDNKEALSSIIDDAINLNKEEVRGRVA